MSNEKEENVRLINGFVARTRWNILIKGQDKKKLIAMAAVPKSNDRLDRVGKMVYKYFEGISAKLRDCHVNGLDANSCCLLSALYTKTINCLNRPRNAEGETNIHEEAV